MIAAGRSFEHVTIAACAEISDQVHLVAREHVLVDFPPLINGATQSPLTKYNLIKSWTCAIAQKLTRYDDLHRIRMARRKRRGESPFLTMNRLQPTRIRLGFWGTLAVEAGLFLALDTLLSSFGFGFGFIKRAVTTSEQIESDGGTPPESVDLPAQQAS